MALIDILAKEREVERTIEFLEDEISEFDSLLNNLDLSLATIKGLEYEREQCKERVNCLNQDLIHVRAAIRASMLDRLQGEYFVK